MSGRVLQWEMRRDAIRDMSRSRGNRIPVNGGHYMELVVNYLGNAQFEAEARGHKIICDQPESNQGDDEGMTPPELLLASLATCSGYYAVQYLKTRKFPTE